VDVGVDAAGTFRQGLEDFRFQDVGAGELVGLA
jgi:hypothetical protein